MEGVSKHFMDELEESLRRRIHRDEVKRLTSQMLTLFWVMLFSMVELIGSLILMVVGVETLAKGSGAMALFNIFACVGAILWLGKKRDDVEHAELKRMTGA
jgi:hypothetical protein